MASASTAAPMIAARSLASSPPMSLSPSNGPISPPRYGPRSTSSTLQPQPEHEDVGDIAAAGRARGELRMRRAGAQYDVARHAVISVAAETDRRIMQRRARIDIGRKAGIGAERQV